MSYSMVNMRDALKNIIVRCEDMMEIYDSYSDDSCLNTYIYIAIDLLEEMRTDDILYYGHDYWVKKYINVDELSDKNTGDIEKVLSYVFMGVDEDELFEGYPDIETVQEDSERYQYTLVKDKWATMEA